MDFTSLLPINFIASIDISVPLFGIIEDEVNIFLVQKLASNPISIKIFFIKLSEIQRSKIHAAEPASISCQLVPEKEIEVDLT